MVVNPVFEDIEVMQDRSGGLIDNVINIKDQGRWRLYRLGYGYPIDPQFVYLGRQREGVWHALYRGKLHGFVDACQRIVLPFAFADAKSFSEGVCAVKWNPRDEYDGNKGWGYVDHAGNSIVRGHYVDACEFRGGLACVKGLRWGIIDRSGRTILPCGSDFDEVHLVLHRLRHPSPAAYKLSKYVPSKDNIAIARNFVFVRDARDMVIAIDHKGGLLSEGMGEAIGLGVIAEGWKDIRQVSAGFDHAMGLTSSGDVVSTWNTREFTKKTEVCSWRNVVLMDSCEGHVAAVMSDGRVVGVTEKDDFEGPTDYSDELQEIRNARRVSVGWDHAAVLLTDGTVKIVGRHCRANQCEQWEDVVDVDVFGCYYSPSQTVGLTVSGRVLHMLGESTPDSWRDIVSVSCGNQFIVALDKFGKVCACGCNNRGQCDVAGWPQMTCVRGDFATTVAIDKEGWVWMTPIGKTQHNVFGKK